MGEKIDGGLNESVYLNNEHIYSIKLIIGDKTINNIPYITFVDPNGKIHKDFEGWVWIDKNDDLTLLNEKNNRSEIMTSIRGVIKDGRMIEGKFGLIGGDTKNSRIKIYGIICFLSGTTS